MWVMERLWEVIRNKEWRGCLVISEVGTDLVLYPSFLSLYHRPNCSCNLQELTEVLALSTLLQAFYSNSKINHLSKISLLASLPLL